MPGWGKWVLAGVWTLRSDRVTNVAQPWGAGAQLCRSWLGHPLLDGLPQTRFMAEVVGIYYKSDQVVAEDQELQNFVNDVYVYGMRGKKASGRGCPALLWASLLLFPAPRACLGQRCSLASALAPGAGARVPTGPLTTSVPHRDISEAFCGP